MLVVTRHDLGWKERGKWVAARLIRTFEITNRCLITWEGRPRCGVSSEGRCDAILNFFIPPFREGRMNRRVSSRSRAGIVGSDRRLHVVKMAKLEAVGSELAGREERWKDESAKLVRPSFSTSPRIRTRASLSKLPLRWIFKITGIPVFLFFPTRNFLLSSLINRSFYAWRDCALRIVSNSYDPLPFPFLSFFLLLARRFSKQTREKHRGTERGNR